MAGAKRNVFFKRLQRSAEADMNTGIYLKHDIDGFSIDNSFVTTLQKQFRNHTFTIYTTVEDLEMSLHEHDIIITWVFKRTWYQKAKRLKAIFTPAAGADWVEYDSDGTIPVFHGAFHGLLIAETLIGMMIYFNRRFGQLQKNQREHHWNRNFLSYSRPLFGQNVMIYGYGNIGRECARVLKTFGCTIIGVKHSPELAFADTNADQIIHPQQCHEHLDIIDHFISILPGTKANDHIFNRDFWNAMNPECFFYNVGRGNCCKEEDLLWALDNKKIAGAGLDVFETEPLPPESKLWDHPGVFIMPHASPLCTGYLPLYLEELSQQLKPFLR